jgi:hypothetical protein
MAATPCQRSAKKVGAPGWTTPFPSHEIISAHTRPAHWVRHYTTWPAAVHPRAQLCAQGQRGAPQRQEGQKERGQCADKDSARQGAAASGGGARACTTGARRTAGAGAASPRWRAPVAAEVPGDRAEHRCPRPHSSMWPASTDRGGRSHSTVRCPPDRRMHAIGPPEAGTVPRPERARCHT